MSCQEKVFKNTLITICATAQHSVYKGAAALTSFNLFTFLLRYPLLVKPKMELEKICNIVNATLHTPTYSRGCKIEKAFSSDLMSDVLTLLADNLLLITGLNNIQTVRTAEMADICHILFVRGKRPSEKMIELAREQEIILMSTSFSMYKTSGLLWAAGLSPVY